MLYRFTLRIFNTWKAITPDSEKVIIMEELLTVKQFAHKKGISSCTVSKWHAMETKPALRPRGQTFPLSYWERIYKRYYRFMDVPAELCKGQHRVRKIVVKSKHADRPPITFGRATLYFDTDIGAWVDVGGKPFYDEDTAMARAEKLHRGIVI